MRQSCACGGSRERDGDECEECRAQRLQGQPDDSAPSRLAPQLVDGALFSRGESLAVPVRAELEAGFGRDLSGVLIHHDARAAESARAVSASAYTVGDHIVFAAGRYAPETVAGRRLLAHELAHVVQQRRPDRDSASVVQRQPAGVEAAASLQSPRFKDCAKLEACFEDRDRLREGDPDTDAVMRVQQALLDLPVADSSGESYDLGPMGADGNYGPRTAAAIRKFKRDEGLGFDQFGDVGPGTMHRLDQLFGPATPGPQPTPVPGGPLLKPKPGVEPTVTELPGGLEVLTRGVGDVLTNIPAPAGGTLPNVLGQERGEEVPGRRVCRPAVRAAVRRDQAGPVRFPVQRHPQNKAPDDPHGRLYSGTSRQYRVLRRAARLAAGRRDEHLRAPRQEYPGRVHSDRRGRGEHDRLP
jgi:peptidoglycan hydrolase-like protein with peptidoglycan-binding domain